MADICSTISYEVNFWAYQAGAQGVLWMLSAGSSRRPQRHQGGRPYAIPLLAICSAIALDPCFDRAESIMFYMPAGSEVNLEPLMLAPPGAG